MSTRCNVLLRSPQGSAIWFYRHSDGYLSGAGRALDGLYTAHIVKCEPGSRGFAWIGDFAERMILARDEQGGRPWRLTAGPHSDIEYCYIFDFAGFEDERSSPEDYAKNVELLKVRWARGGYGDEVYKKAQAATPQTIEQFRRDVYKPADRAEDAG